jgi:bla regulator protein blaR1
VTYEVYEYPAAQEALQGGEIAAAEALIPVNYDAVDGSLTSEQKQKVKSTVDATRKIIGNMQWEVIDQKLADVMTQAEKEKAKAQYLQMLEQKVNWQNVEQNIKAQYEQMDWSSIDNRINRAMVDLQRDSLQKKYQEVLVELSRAREEAQAKSRVTLSPLPDQSLADMKRYTEEMRKRVDSIKTIRQPKKVVRL